MDRLIKILIPTSFQVIVVFMLSVMTFSAIYGPSIFTRILTGEISSYVGQSYTEQLVRLNAISFVRTGVIAAFWALVGLAAYAVYLIITNAIVEARNEVVIDTEYANRGAVTSAWQGVGKQLGCGVVLILLIVISATLLLPVWSRLFETAIFNDFVLVNALISTAGVLCLALNLYAIWAMVQITWSINQL